MKRSVKRIKEISQFKVINESGKEYIIIQYQEYVNAGSGDHPNDEIPGRKLFLTYDGALVNYVDSKTFEIFATKEIVRKV